MNAMERVAWTELVVSVVAVAAATMLIPWLASSATVAFALLGLIGLSMAFVRKSGSGVVVDERDQEIGRKATRIGVATAWMTLLIAIIAATMWGNYSNSGSVSTRFLNWLIWLQFAICYGTRGLVAVVVYRKQQHAT